MKRYMTKYIALTGGLLMLGSLSGCQLDDPVIPAEELYIRGFIKQYGLIDPTQDFSSAMQTTVTLNIPGSASVVNVYAKMGEDLYRVGCFADLQGTVGLPVDVSEATETIVVDVDGVRYSTTPGGTVNVKSGSSAVASRAGESTVPDSYNVRSLWIDPLQWVNETAKNGETEDLYAKGPRQVIFINGDGSISNEDKNRDLSNPDIYGTGKYGNSVFKDELSTHYFDVSYSGHIGKNLLGDKTHQTTLCENSGANPGDVATTSVGSNVRFLIKNNDEALAAYRFVFRTASQNKGKVRVVLLGQHKTDGNGDGVYIFMDNKLDIDASIDHGKPLNTYTEGKYTEWELRTDLMPRGYYELIIMGVESESNPDGDKTCGNWGFMRMERIKTATDMKWILACEDLGTTDDFDFNDVVFSIEAVNTNTAAMKLGVIQWQVVDNSCVNDGREVGTVIRPANAPSRADETDRPSNSSYKTQITVTALAAGGTLPIWLHFREEESADKTTGTSIGTDYILCPSSDNGDRGCLRKLVDVAASETAAEEAGAPISECSEWHRWFGEHSSKNMLNTGVSRHISDTKSVTFYTNNVFSLENFCYLKFKTDSDEGDLPYYFDKDTDLDPWSKKVLQWQWQQAHSQEVTYGFFLTVYKPDVKSSESHILSKSLDGLPPQMFLIPDCNSMPATGYAGQDFGWCWPCERVDITKVYPNFRAWVEEATGYYGMNWFMLPKTGDVTYKLYPRAPSKQEAFKPFQLGTTE